MYFKYKKISLNYNLFFINFIKKFFFKFKKQ